MISLDEYMIHKGKANLTFYLIIIFKDWIPKIKSEFAKFNDGFPDNFKIKCKTTKIVEKGIEYELHGIDSFLCMIDYFRNLLVHIPLPGMKYMNFSQVFKIIFKTKCYLFA